MKLDFGKKSLVVISGASRGIGQTIAVEFSKILPPESIFVLLARSSEGLEETKKLISESMKVLTFAVDLSQPDKAIYEEILAKIDLQGVEFAYLFHNAGHVGVLKQTTELNSLEIWQNYYNLNLFSAILLNNAFFLKIKGPQLVVVNITSAVGRTPFTNMSMYGTAKAARDLFFKVLAVEQPLVKVLNYSPGPVLTDMFNDVCLTADSQELRDSFQKMRQMSQVLTCQQTVARLLDVLLKNQYASGATIDYFDAE